MDAFEVEQRETITRTEAATRLRRIATLLSGDDDEVEFERAGMKFKVSLPEEVEFKVEFEMDAKESELKW